MTQKWSFWDPFWDPFFGVYPLIAVQEGQKVGPKNGPKIDQKWSKFGNLDIFSHFLFPLEQKWGTKNDPK